MKYVFIEKHQAEFSIKAMCRVLRVARSGWYTWCQRRTRISTRQQFRQHCDSVVLAAFTRSKQRYGAPRLTDGIIQIIQGKCSGLTGNVGFLSDNTEAVTAYQTTQTNDITVMTSIADYYVRFKFPDNLMQSEDGRRGKAVPEMNKSDIMPSFSGFRSNFTFFLCWQVKRNAPVFGVLSSGPAPTAPGLQDLAKIQ